MVQADELMPSHPSKNAEATVAFFIPPACREEVLGDLYERYKSPAQYAWEALSTLPLVVLSRVRRTSDSQALLIQTFAIYSSFLTPPWVLATGIPPDQWQLWRPAIPTAIAMLGLVLEDAYSKSARSFLGLARGPLVGIGLALVAGILLRLNGAVLSLPVWVTLWGCGISLLLSSGVRRLFSPMRNEAQGVNAPVHWLRPSTEQAPGSTTRLQIVVTLIALCLILLVGYHVWKKE